MTQLLEILLITLIVMVISGWLCVWRRLFDMEDTIGELNHMTNDNIFKTSKLIVEGLEHLDKNFEKDYDMLVQTLLYEMKVAQEEREEILQELKIINDERELNRAMSVWQTNKQNDV